MSNSRPLVSIVTPSFNSGDFLEQAIQSVLKQGYQKLEHIVVDGGSTDNTLEILRRYGSPLTWTSEPDEGQADAINKGFRRAKGEIIGWLNADDTYDPQAIAAAVEQLQKEPAVDVVYGNYNFVDAQGRWLYTHLTPEFSLDRLLYGDAIIPQTSMFFRRQVLAETGGVNPQLHYVMDWEFTLRLAQRYTIKRVDQTWGNFRIVEGTKSVQQPERFWPEIIAVLQQMELQETRQSVLKDALFMSHLRAGVEFARAGQLSTAQHYINLAFDIVPQPKIHPAILAAGLFKTSTYPWHSAFKPHPQAPRTLQTLARCLDDSPFKRQIQGYLKLYQVGRGLRQGQRQNFIQNLGQALASLNGRDLVDWRLFRMMLGAIFG